MKEEDKFIVVSGPGENLESIQTLLSLANKYETRKEAEVKCEMLNDEHKDLMWQPIQIKKLKMIKKLKKL